MVYRHRHYSAIDREHFAAYTAERARFRPPECHGGNHCWVVEGPPAIASRKPAEKPAGYTSGIFCRGCGGRPNVPGRWRHWNGPRRG